MFQYESECRPGSSSSGFSRATCSTTISSRAPGFSPARRPLPPRPSVCERMPAKTTVPLKVWVIASASCFAVCAALVLATVAITRWGTAQYTTQLLEEPEPVFSNPHPVYTAQKPVSTTTEPDTTTIDNNIDNDMELFEKISFFKNIVARREHAKANKNLISKLQIHPVHDTTVEHAERKIEKKYQAKLPIDADITETSNDINKKVIPDFKPTLPDVFIDGEIKLSDGYLLGLRNDMSDYDDYYSDNNLYDDYMQSNTMTNYLIEKVQELHDWITTDPDFEVVKNSSDIAKKGTQFSEVLQALNHSLVQGNVTIVMNKLKDLYFGDNYTGGHGKRMIVSNSTDLLSFGILSLDIMLLHNIQLMAWENQESVRTKMLKDPDVFAFNALFMDPSKIEMTQNEINYPSAFSKRQGVRQDTEEMDLGKSLIEGVLDAGMSAARAAIHLGRAYKNTKAILNQAQNREPQSLQLSRSIDSNSAALRLVQHLGVNGSVADPTSSYTSLDCVWLLYCRNLPPTAKLNAPYGLMARINGIALRMMTGELSADRTIETMVYEAMSGWTELNCNQMFPRCSKVDAASVVMETILQPLRKS